jgi:hypothetical protein
MFKFMNTLLPNLDWFESTLSRSVILMQNMFISLAQYGTWITCSLIAETESI